MKELRYSRERWGEWLAAFAARGAGSGVPASTLRRALDDPTRFDAEIIDYQVSLSLPLVEMAQARICREAFPDADVGRECAGAIDWAVFHRQIFPAVCASRLMGASVGDVGDLAYCYALLVVGPTQLLDEKLDNPFAPGIRIANPKLWDGGLWLLSDLMARRGADLLNSLCPRAAGALFPLVYQMAYGMREESRMGRYSHDLLANPEPVLALYASPVPPTMSTVFNETMLVGGLLHLGISDSEAVRWVPVARGMRLLRQSLNEVEDAVADLSCGVIKRPMARLLADGSVGEEAKEIIGRGFWADDSVDEARRLSERLSLEEWHSWLGSRPYARRLLELWRDSGLQADEYRNIDRLCLESAEAVLAAAGDRPCFDLLTIVFLKRALLERVALNGFGPQVLGNERLGGLNGLLEPG
jgi:hypothetical protein